MATLPPADLTIGELAERTGVKVQTIRYYEFIGLLPLPERTAGNQRRYAMIVADKLKFIRHSRDLGFDIAEIRNLLSLAAHPDQPCDEADVIARDHLAQVEQRIAVLSSLRDELKRMIRQCKGGRIGTCRVIDALADHAHCKADHRPISSRDQAAPHLRR